LFLISYPKPDIPHHLKRTHIYNTLSSILCESVECNNIKHVPVNVGL